MTTSERTTFEATLTASEEGMLVFDKDLDMLYSWDGSSWISPVGANFQNLVGSLAGETLTIDIENGTSAVVDLSSLLTDIKATLVAQDTKNSEQDALIDELYEIVAAQAIQIAQMQEDIASFTGRITGLGSDASLTGARLDQSTPNPSDGRISISFYIPDAVKNAQILVFDLKGIFHMNIPILSRGEGSIEINKGELSPGHYLYTLLADGVKVGTKKMIVQ